MKKPHKGSASGGQNRDLEAAIGREVRRRRRVGDITVAELADAAGLSLGMLSKIENGVTSPSLASLQAIAAALAVPLSELLRPFEADNAAVFTRAGEGSDVERHETRAGQRFLSLGHVRPAGGGTALESFTVALGANCDTDTRFRIDGVASIHLTEGEMVFAHGDELFRMKAGDNLLFDAGISHGPAEILRAPVRYVAVVSCR